jgi:hypothetical protein
VIDDNFMEDDGEVDEGKRGHSARLIMVPMMRKAPKTMTVGIVKMAE